MISLQPFLLGAALASFASAAALEVARQDVDCYTIWADGHRNHVPTYYETVVQKETSRFTSTSTPVSTVTSVGATSTITVTISTTATTGDGVSTVTASVGYTPLASVIAANQVVAQAVEPQVTPAPEYSRIDSLSRLTDCRYYDDCYPAQVNCIVHVKRIVTTTQVIQANATVTSTVVPVGVTASTTITTTDTIIASVAATATTFAVCQSNNIIANYSDTAGWRDAQFNGYLGMSAGTGGYDCCTKCVLMGDSCQASAYTVTVLGGNCAYFLSAEDNPTCVGTTAAGIALYQSGTTTSNYVFSNSNCGQLQVQAAT